MRLALVTLLAALALAAPAQRAARHRADGDRVRRGAALRRSTQGGAHARRVHEQRRRDGRLGQRRVPAPRPAVDPRTSASRSRRRWSSCSCACPPATAGHVARLPARARAARAIATQDGPRQRPGRRSCFADPNGAATIDYVDADVRVGAPPRSASTTSRSPRSRQPDTAISGPTVFEANQTATFTFTSSATPASFECAVDKAEFAPCKNPIALSGLAIGTHTLTVRAVDVYGVADADARPRSTSTCSCPRASPPIPDADSDGVPDATDNCPANANSRPGGQRQGRRRRRLRHAPARQRAADGGGDERRPGALRRGVREAAGQDHAGLPRHARAVPGGRVPVRSRAPRRSRSARPSTPARARSTIESAANGYAAVGPPRPPAAARIKAGIFAIRQKRAKLAKTSLADRRRAGQPARRRGLAACNTSPARSRAPCARSRWSSRATTARSAARARRPPRAAPRSPTTDRCDGTLTAVGKGKVTVAIKGKPDAKPITVKAGRAYLVKAKLFRVRKGKPIRKGGT